MEKGTKFFGADLHVHTPSSSCYKDKKNEEEYFNIIKNYVDKNIRIIAITDHNSLHGYKKITELREKYQQRLTILSEYKNQAEKIDKEILELENKISVFKKIMILPGVEFEANPGIHILFIFDPKAQLNDIDQFLLTCGYSNISQGKESVDCVNVDVLDALQMAKKLDAITIAAHVDSDKGIYNDLSGQYRARVFSSEYLDAISVNSVGQIEKIKSMLNNPTYKRSDPLAIIQSSDHHKKDDCGKNLTYFQLDKVNYQNFKDCFSDPNEKISSTERPEIKNILRKIAGDENSLCLEELDYKELSANIVALLNDNYGNVMIGVSNTSYRTLKGIEFSIDDREELRKRIISTIDLEKIFYSLRISIYPFGKKQILIIKVNNISDKIFSTNEKVYILEKKTKQAVEANNLSLAQIIEQKNQLKLELFQENFDKQMLNITRELNVISNSSLNFKILRKIDENSIKLRRLLDAEIIKSNMDLEIKKKYLHGDYSGTIFYAEPESPRCEDIHIRYTCPRFSNDCVIEDIKKYNGPCIILVPGGAIYYIEEEEFLFVNNETAYPYIKLKINKEFQDDIDIITVLAWMKSTIVIWKSLVNYGDCDFWIPDIFNDVKFPVSLLKSSTSNSINEKILEIIEKEEEYLKYQVQLIDSSEKSDELEALIYDKATKHNHEVSVIVNVIDQIIYDSLSIGEDEIELITSIVEENNMIVNPIEQDDAT